MLSIKSFLLAALLAFTVSLAFAQNTDKFETTAGTLTVQPITHASFILSGKQLIYVDPTGGKAAYPGSKAPDIILITDIHGDHNDPKTINELKDDHTIIVAPKAVADSLTNISAEKLVVLSNGERATQNGIEIEAIPMYNLPETADSKHPKGRGNGYVLTVGGKRLYISGDTEDIPEMRALKNIDIAFVCMNLPYTMDINQAASGVLAFQPKIVYPYHYRGTEGLSDVKAFKSLVNKGNKSIDVRLRKWYPNE